MHKDRKKNVQARQSSDGTFELFVGAGGLEEISEEEVSYAEIVSSVDPQIEKKPSSKIVFFAFGAILLLGIGVALFVFSGNEKKKKQSEELSEVQGFRAYNGVAPSRKNNRLTKKSTFKKPAQIARDPEPQKHAERGDDETGTTVAWKLGAQEEEARLAEQEARIQPNRNPSPESVDIVFLDENDEEIIRDLSEEGEVPPHKNGFLTPRLGTIPNVIKMPNLKSIKPNIPGRNIPQNFGGSLPRKFKNIPGTAPSSASDPTKDEEVEGEEVEGE